MEGKEAGRGNGQPSGRKRRVTYGAFPEPGKGDVPYANSRDELAGVTLGEKVGLVMATAAWNDVLGPVLAQMDEDRPRRGPAPSYTSAELESCLLYQRLAGASTYAQARSRLAGDRGEADRVALGFDRTRKRVGAGLRLVKSLDGVPSEVTVWRHKQRFGLDEHVAVYRTLFERLVRDHFKEFPELAEEARLVYWDGSILLSHYCSFERENRRTGEIKPPTLTGGSFRPRQVDNAGKDGHGFNLISGVTQTGLPIAARLTSLKEGEGQTAREILEEDWPKTVAPYLKDDAVRVMASDGAYSGGHFRKAVHEAGFIPNCHSVSHAKRERSRAYAQGRNEAKLTIQYHPNWFLNGHRELSCACGEGKTMRRGEKKADGAATARLEGSCPNCGPISLTAGQWRFANQKSVRRMLPGDPESVRDWRTGNPLTYHDPLSAEYGSARFGHQEGFHGALVTRFGLLKEKSWYRDRRQAERDVLQVFCSIHAIAMEQRRRAAGGVPAKNKSGPPPPLALAA